MKLYKIKLKQKLHLKDNKNLLIEDTYKIKLNLQYLKSFYQNILLKV